MKTASTLREMHITSFFQVGMSQLEAEERRKKLFEAEEERDRKILEELIQKQREIEEKVLGEIFQNVLEDEKQRLLEEKEKIEEQRKILELRQEDRKTNHIGKKLEDNLFVGGEVVASNEDWVTENNIKFILNVTSNIKNFFEDRETVKYHRIPIEDSYEENIGQFFKDTAEMIDQEMKNGGVLVHCKQGQSRSCAILVSFLMQKRNMSFQEAHKHLFSVRPLMSINEGFISQLEQLEKDLTKDPAEEQKEGKKKSLSKQMQELIESSMKDQGDSPDRRRSSRTSKKMVNYNEHDQIEEKLKKLKKDVIRNPKKKSNKSQKPMKKTSQKKPIVSGVKEETGSVPNPSGSPIPVDPLPSEPVLTLSLNSLVDSDPAKESLENAPSSKKDLSVPPQCAGEHQRSEIEEPLTERIENMTESDQTNEEATATKRKMRDEPLTNSKKQKKTLFDFFSQP